jgi:hypothetical protein
VENAKHVECENPNVLNERANEGIKMPDFLTELQEIREKALANAQSERLRIARERFQSEFRQKLLDMEEGIKNELRRMVAKNPTVTQHFVQRTITEIRDNSHILHTYRRHVPMQPNGMCAFLQSHHTIQDTFYAELALLFPWCTMTFKEMPHPPCNPSSKHWIRITCTIFLTCAV